MSLNDWITGNAIRAAATATPATVATVDGQKGRSVADVATVAVANPQTRKTDALAIVKGRGVQLVTHRGHRIVVVSADQDTAGLRAALEVLGYSGCRVLHLDTAPYRGKGVDSIAEAIEDRP